MVDEIIRGLAAAMRRQRGSTVRRIRLVPRCHFKVNAPARWNIPLLAPIEGLIELAGGPETTWRRGPDGSGYLRTVVMSIDGRLFLSLAMRDGHYHYEMFERPILSVVLDDPESLPRLAAALARHAKVTLTLP